MFKALILITIAGLHLVACGEEPNPDEKYVFDELDIQYAAADELRTFTTDSATYATSLLKTNWYSAQLACIRNNMTLASINSFEEGEDIRTHLISEGFLRSGNEIFWLSGADFGTPRIFFWHRTGRRIDYRNWSFKEPKKVTPGCIAMRNNGRWINSQCTKEFYYICQERS